MQPRACIAACLFVLIQWANAEGGYYGKYIGPLGNYHHGVSGEVYAVDQRTLHIRSFTYDGEGPAAYFYVGNTKTPGVGGIRVRDETGSLGVLKRYNKKHITLTLPEGKSLSQMKWFSVWCDEFSVNFGDIKFPRGMEYPKPQKIGSLAGVHGVSSDPIVVVDAQTLLVPSFSYDGEAPDAKFWVGRGAMPTPQGIRVPDENGKQTPLRQYQRKTIVLTLPGDLTVYDIDYFGVWCEAFTVDFGHVKIPQALDVPPSLKMLGVSPQKRSLHQTSAEEKTRNSAYDASTSVTTYRPHAAPKVQHIFHPTEYHRNFIQPGSLVQLVDGPGQKEPNPYQQIRYEQLPQYQEQQQLQQYQQYPVIPQSQPERSAYLNRQQALYQNLPERPPAHFQNPVPVQEPSQFQKLQEQPVLQYQNIPPQQLLQYQPLIPQYQNTHLRPQFQYNQIQYNNAPERPSSQYKDSPARSQQQYKPERAPVQYQNLPDRPQPQYKPEGAPVQYQNLPERPQLQYQNIPPQQAFPFNQIQYPFQHQPVPLQYQPFQIQQNLPQKVERYQPNSRPQLLPQQQNPPQYQNLKSAQNQQLKQSAAQYQQPNKPAQYREEKAFPFQPFNFQPTPLTIQPYNLQALDDSVQIVPSIALHPEGAYSPRVNELAPPFAHLYPPAFLQPHTTNIIERRSFKH